MLSTSALLLLTEVTMTSQVTLLYRGLLKAALVFGNHYFEYKNKTKNRCTYVCVCKKNSNYNR